MSQTYTEWLQSRLTAHGFPCGAIDGDYGDLTKAALRSFRRARGLPAAGGADRAAEALLRASASVVSPAVQAAIPNRDDPNDPAIQRIALVDQRWPRQRDVQAVFGAPGTGLTEIAVPYDMVLAWDKGARVRRMTLNKLVAQSALRILQRTAEVYSPAERAALGLNLFGGAFNKRRMRGGTSWSMHAYGIALDFDPERNALNAHAPAARLSHADAKAFWDLWQTEGWLSLGRARDFDWMHVQAARL